jgi:hypothetical protein
MGPRFRDLFEGFITRHGRLSFTRFGPPPATCSMLVTSVTATEMQGLIREISSTEDYCVEVCAVVTRGRHQGENGNYCTSTIVDIIG